MRTFVPHPISNLSFHCSLGTVHFHHFASGGRQSRRAAHSMDFRAPLTVLIRGACALSAGLHGEPLSKCLSSATAKPRRDRSCGPESEKPQSRSDKNPQPHKKSFSAMTFRQAVHADFRHGFHRQALRPTFGKGKSETGHHPHKIHGGCRGIFFFPASSGSAIS